ncbi:unnamed protein product [Caenorhabditis nigoni]
MISYKISGIFIEIGFALGLISNLLLIYLTLFHIKKVTGTYKKMVILFSTISILFATLEITARPFSHNYKHFLVFFSTNTWIESKNFRLLLVAIWAGFYLLVVAFISVQFFYRYFCLFDGAKAKQFDGWKSMFWMGYPFVPAAIYGASFYWFCMPDEYSDQSLRKIVLEYYSIEVTDLPRFVMIPYAPDGSIRWLNISFLISGLCNIFFHYSIILYCGLKMHFNIANKLKMCSKFQSDLQNQFFRALVAQSIGPTLFLVLPIAPILAVPLMSPYLGTEVSWQPGWLYSIVGLFPPFDSLAFMLIVKEYTKIGLDA